jgi:hypothetical protein
MGWLDSFHKEGRLELIKNSHVGCRLAGADPEGGGPS